MSALSNCILISCSAYLSQSEEENVASSNFAPYDQYEVSIPMDIAGDCLQMVSHRQPISNMLCAQCDLFGTVTGNQPAERFVHDRLIGQSLPARVDCVHVLDPKTQELVRAAGYQQAIRRKKRKALLRVLKTASDVLLLIRDNSAVCDLTVSHVLTM